MKHPNARLSAGIVAISLAAQSVVFAQGATTAATPSTATPSAATQPMATQSAANGGASSTGSGTSDVSATAGATANGTPVGTPMDAATVAATVAASSTAAVSTSGVTTSGLADVRNADDAQAPLLTLADVLTLALQNNPTLTSAQAAVRAAQARVGTARSAGGVQVGLSGDVNGNRNFGGSSSTGFSSGTGTGGTGTGGTGSGGTGGGGTGGIGTGGIGSIPTSGNQILGLNTNESVGVSATLPVYTGGRVKASTRVARTGVDIQAANAQQTEQDLLLNTTTSYLNILRSGQLLQVANSNVDISREQLRVAQVRFNAGAAARLEVFQAEATLADSQQRRTAASATLGQSKATLNTLIGRVPETPVRVEPITALNLSLPQITTTAASGATASGATASGAATSGATITSSSTSTTLATESAAGDSSTTSTSATSSSATSITPGASAIETAVSATPAGSGTLSSAELRAQALASRPLLAASQAQIANSQANVDLARAQRKPNIGVTLGSFLRNPVTFAGRFALSLGLGLSQTLFDSGRSRSQINEAQALLDQSRSGLAGQELNVGNQIEQSLLSLDSAQARTVSADTAVTSAQEALRAAQVAYQAGVRTSLEVSTAQTALLNAQTNAVNARFDVATGQAQLASAVGVLTTQAQTAATRNTQAQVDAAAAQAQADAAKPKKKRKKFLGIF